LGFDTPTRIGNDVMVSRRWKVIVYTGTIAPAPPHPTGVHS
jgi:hypothetical protein